MGYIFTFDGPVWEHVAGQWYQGCNGGAEYMLCDACAEAWSIDNADFSYEGHDEGYRQTGGFLEAVEALVGDQCVQCERTHGATSADVGSATARDAPVAGTRRLPVLLALCALLAIQACVHGPSFGQVMRQNHCRLTSADTHNEPAFVYNGFTGRAVPYMRSVTTECYRCGSVTECGPR